MRVEHHQKRLGGLYLVIATAYEPVSRLGLGPGSFIDEPKCSHSAPDTFLLTKSVVTSGRVTPEFNPPTSWWLASDEKTRKDVMTIITAAFEIASKAPPRLRDQAYREASFMVPYEIARLNLDAPRFKVEEMAPLSSLRKQWQVLERGGIHIKSPFNVETDARVFLYFPNGSAKAAAAFLAINAEYQPLERQLKPGSRHYKASDNQVGLLTIAANIWLCQNVHWACRHPDILHRIGAPQLPVIIIFRGSACGAVWDSSSSLFPDLSRFENVFNFIAKDK